MTRRFAAIGLATAKRFVEDGAYVFIAGRRQEQLEKAVAEMGKNVTAVKSDISKLDDLNRLCEIVAKKCKIDMIVAGAGFVERQRPPQWRPSISDKTFNTMPAALIFTVQKVLPDLNDGASMSSWCPPERTKAS